VGPGCTGGNLGELSPAYLRSSIRASLSGRAEGYYSAELGTAHISEPVYQTSKCLEFSAEMGIVEMNRATKHTQAGLLRLSTCHRAIRFFPPPCISFCIRLCIGQKKYTCSPANHPNRIHSKRSRLNYVRTLTLPPIKCL
jgi:hypothetical protein